MSSSRQLWFHIEKTTTDIQRLCREVRALELRARQPKNVVSAGPPSEFDLDTQEISAPFGAPGAPRTRTAAGPLAVDIVALRAELRKRLFWLKAKLSETLTEREVHFVLFPVVIFTDELVQSAIEGATNLWKPFQMELYDIDSGGESFYSALEELLRKEETLPLIFEVFYFCLSDGFRGQYVNDPAKIEEYKSRLAQRIPVEKLRSEEPPVEEGEVRLVEFPKWYYIGAAGTAAGALLILWLIAG